MATQETKKNKNTLTQNVVNFLAGGVSAAFSKTVAAPIERVKLLLQNQDEMLKTGKLQTPYRGIMDCFKRVIQEEGVYFLWRGNLANVIRYFPTQALNFMFNDFFKATFNKTKEKDGWAAYFFSNLASGSLAGGLSLCVVYPLDFARTRLAADNKSAKSGGARQFNGLIDVFRKTHASDGIVGIYRGFVISLVGIIVYRGLYFGLYNTVRPLTQDLTQGSPFVDLVNFLVAWGVTILAGFASYPLDTVRRRMMMTSGEAVKYKSSIHCFVEIAKNEGIKSFFKGNASNILRAIAGAGALAGYDKLQRVIKASREKKA